MIYPILSWPYFRRCYQFYAIAAMKGGLYAAQDAVYIGIVGMSANLVPLFEGIVKYSAVLGQDVTISIWREYGYVVIVET